MPANTIKEENCVIEIVKSKYLLNCCGKMQEKGYINVELEAMSTQLQVYYNIQKCLLRDLKWEKLPSNIIKEEDCVIKMVQSSYLHHCYDQMHEIGWIYVEFEAM